MSVGTSKLGDEPLESEGVAHPVFQGEGGGKGGTRLNISVYLSFLFPASEGLHNTYVYVPDRCSVDGLTSLSRPDAKLFLALLSRIHEVKNSHPLTPPLPLRQRPPPLLAGLTRTVRDVCMGKYKCVIRPRATPSTFRFNVLSFAITAFHLSLRVSCVFVFPSRQSSGELITTRQQQRIPFVLSSVHSCYIFFFVGAKVGSFFRRKLCVSRRSRSWASFRRHEELSKRLKII